MMHLGFYGAAGEVTGSCTLVSNDHARVMVDMGMHQGELEANDHNRRMPPIEPGRLSAIVLTHAHLDHCGRLPMIVKAGYTGPIFCTKETAQLTEIILRDSAKIQEEDTLRYNIKIRRPDQPAIRALYEVRDVEKTIALFRVVPYNTLTTIAEGFSITLTDAGHILGSTSVQMMIHDGERTVNLVFSGDIGPIGSPILHDPVTPPSAQCVVLESTYGDRDHRPRQETIDELLAILLDAQKTGSKVLIPAFAVGRTQDLIYCMGEFVRQGKISNLKVFIDSPMAVAVSKLYRTAGELYDSEAQAIVDAGNCPLNFPGLTYIKTVDESKALNSYKGFIVVIAASGMCTGGRIVHHLAHHLPIPTTHVVIVGYQGQGTLGRQLVDGARQVRIMAQTVPVNAKVHTLGGLSAHAGKSELVKWLAPLASQNPTLLLNHGENPPRAALHDAIKQTYSIDGKMPEYGETYQL